jgi:hypothetical protein
MAGLGAVAQLGERLVCNQEATGSIPVSSTKFRYQVLGLRSQQPGDLPET